MSNELMARGLRSLFLWGVKTIQFIFNLMFVKRKSIVLLFCPTKINFRKPNVSGCAGMLRENFLAEINL